MDDQPHHQLVVEPSFPESRGPGGLQDRLHPGSSDSRESRGHGMPADLLKRDLVHRVSAHHDLLGSFMRMSPPESGTTDFTGFTGTQEPTR
jgi:hypothetical protein